MTSADACVLFATANHHPQSKQKALEDALARKERKSKKKERRVAAAAGDMSPGAQL